jgi:hypothetical protein
LLFKGPQDSGPAFIERIQLRQPFTNSRDGGLIKRSRRFLSVSRNKGNRCPILQQPGCGLHLLEREMEFIGD